jgi:hypothetical protein
MIINELNLKIKCDATKKKTHVKRRRKILLNLIIRPRKLYKK